MIMEENNLHTEMENLREQMQAFKSQLDKQKILNEQLIINSMKKNISWIKKFIIFEVCTIPLIALAWVWLKNLLGLSWYNYAFMMFAVIVDVYADYRINVSSLSDADYSSNNLITTATKLYRMKYQRRQTMLIEIPLFLIWIVWCVMESLAHVAQATDTYLAYGNIIGMVIGALISIPVAIYVYRKMQKTNDALISQIRELTEPA